MNSLLGADPLQVDLFKMLSSSVMSFNANRNTFRGGGGSSVKMFCLSSEKGSTLQGKHLLPHFPCRVHPFSEGD